MLLFSEFVYPFELTSFLIPCGHPGRHRSGPAGELTWSRQTTT